MSTPDTPPDRPADSAETAAAKPEVVGTPDAVIDEGAGEATVVTGATDATDATVNADPTVDAGAHDATASSPDVDTDTTFVGVANYERADAAETFAPYPGDGGFAAYPGAGGGYGPATYEVEPPPSAVADETSGRLACPHCGSAIEAWAGFCESCGQQVTPSAAMPMASAAPGAVEDDSAATRPNRRRPKPAPLHPCAECGGPVGADLYCEQCGAKAPNARDHFREAPAAWVAGVSDRGIKHHRNEDAMALAAGGDRDDEAGASAVLVVCDGVSNSLDSHLVSLPAARSARDRLAADRDGATPAPDTELFTAAVAAANDAVLDNTDPDSDSPGSCTFAAAVVAGGRVWFGNIGDARVYWLDDVSGASQLLSTDDSMAQARIAMGIDRETAENGPQAHAITRWLGRDAPDLVPTTGMIDLPGKGWVLVCSDGLWNYASEPEALHELVVEALTRNPGNQRVRSLAVSLVRWARFQGGKDNITVALARVGDFSGWPASASPPTAPTE